MSAHTLFPNLFPPPAHQQKQQHKPLGQHHQDEVDSVWSSSESGTGGTSSSVAEGLPLGLPSSSTSSLATTVSSSGGTTTGIKSSPSSHAPGDGEEASTLVVMQSRPTLGGGSTFQSSSPPKSAQQYNTISHNSTALDTNPSQQPLQQQQPRRQPSASESVQSSPELGGSNFSQSPQFADDSSDFIISPSSFQQTTSAQSVPTSPQITQQMRSMALGSETPVDETPQQPRHQQQPLQQPPPPPRTVKKQKLTPLSSFEVCGTLGTGTFGRVLLVRVRSPSTPPNAPHPIFLPSLSSSSSSSSQQQQHHRGKKEEQQRPHYAMKILQKSEIVRLKQVEHINSERAILSRVRHPFIVDLYETYQDSLNVYMLLSFIPGGELFSHLRRAGRFTPDVTRFYSSSIILAIAYLHSHDIIYRDLKPENLLLDQQGYLRLADFGFAKEVNDRTFTLCGTPEYLAPEIVLSKGHGKAVDWWALGILCFEMLAGYPPFFDDNPIGIYEKILSGKIAFPPHIDSYSKDLIRRLLTADRSKRLGNLRGGAMDVLMHPFFEFVDWRSLERREITAPIIPHVTNPGDIQNFQHYPNPRPEDLPGLFGSRTGKPAPEETPAMAAHFEAF